MGGVTNIKIEVKFQESTRLRALVMEQVPWQRPLWKRVVPSKNILVRSQVSGLYTQMTIWKPFKRHQPVLGRRERSSGPVVETISPQGAADWQSADLSDTTRTFISINFSWQHEDKFP
jgi:hypothetical protein